MLTERAADGWATRRTVTGGPDSCANAMPKVKLRSPARGCEIPPAYVTDTLCDGQGGPGGGGSGGGCGRVRKRVRPAAQARAAAAAMPAVRRRRRCGRSRAGGGGTGR
ncbi:hypothetical protein ACFVYR_23125 [Streptomyces sp. NPDC058284]|uniref:hypothetical protein n=1 Tax=unclassified Streptomyces TaxID=2593676 RepID=UPI00364D2CFD